MGAHRATQAPEAEEELPEDVPGHLRPRRGTGSCRTPRPWRRPRPISDGRHLRSSSNDNSTWPGWPSSRCYVGRRKPKTKATGSFVRWTAWCARPRWRRPLGSSRPGRTPVPTWAWGQVNPPEGRPPGPPFGHRTRGSVHRPTPLYLDPCLRPRRTRGRPHVFPGQRPGPQAGLGAPDRPRHQPRGPSLVWRKGTS
jgi:hypothetical protein